MLKTLRLRFTHSLVAAKLALFGVLATGGFVTDARAVTPSQRIDQMVEERLGKLGIPVNPPTTDAQFVRRIYLDLVGRVPSLTESQRFLSIENPAKRSILIRILLESEGHVSHSYNYWADILRAKSGGGRDVAADAYVGWVKDRLRANTPYDEFVRELVTAEGQAWENPAVGFYLRDRNMPLDHMAYTAQVFLAKGMVCAQCHDHPFDDISQMEFYQMAAFTYGVSTSIRPQAVLGIDKMLGAKSSSSGNKSRNYNRHINTAAEDLLEPISAGLEDTNRQLKLPQDYQYEDAKPGDAVRAATLFGDRAGQSRGKTMRRSYADWMTSKDNERFTKVIANRLWARVMGRGLVEPLDDFKDGIEASFPQLLDFLIAEMQRLEYDQQAFLSMLYNTRTYQRQVTADYVSPGSDYHFQGPLLRRMTAEQLWDSLLTLTIPDPDNRKASDRNAQRIEAARARAKQIVEMNKTQLVSAVTSLADIHAKLEADTADLRADLISAITAKDQPKINLLRKEIRTFERASQTAQNEFMAAFYKGEAGVAGDPLMMMRMQEMSMMSDAEKKAQKKRQAAEAKENRASDPWAGFGADLVRASELSSPAPQGHFLRQFGQSDREVIGNSNHETSSDQALSLMNGKVFSQITSPKAELTKAIAAASTPRKKLDTVFLSMLGRMPDEREIRRLDSALEADADAVCRDLIWALLNSSEFSFVQ